MAKTEDRATDEQQVALVEEADGAEKDEKKDEHKAF
jgi:hypothetical protein